MNLRVRAGVAVLAAVVVTLVTPASSYGWGPNAVRLITNKAVDTMPQEVLPFSKRTGIFWCST